MVADNAALAALLEGQERCDEAEALYRRALAIFRSSLDPTHPKIDLCERNYAELRRELQKRA